MRFTMSIRRMPICRHAFDHFDRIDKKFDTVHALKGVSISFYPGEIHGLIGENGSGKSTLSSIISGIYPATEGTMVLEGKDYKPVSILDGENPWGSK